MRVIKTRTWIIITASALAVCAVLAAWLTLRGAGGTVANIYRDGELIMSIDLALVTQPQTFTLSDESGTNTITVERGRICVSEADCPDQVCVRAGWLSDSASPIVCLPHRLVIQLGSGGGADTAAG